MASAKMAEHPVSVGSDRRRRTKITVLATVHEWVKDPASFAFAPVKSKYLEQVSEDLRRHPLPTRERMLARRAHLRFHYERAGLVDGVDFSLTTEFVRIPKEDEHLEREVVDPPELNYMTPRDAAEHHGVALSTIYLAIKRGELHAVEVLGKTVLRRQEVLDYKPGADRRRKGGT